jgi:squalene-hopene/tetraprenyl-beta-curcumene cyclase
MTDLSRLDTAIRQLSDHLRDRRVAGGQWEGQLASSALSTATAILAIHLADRERLNDFVEAGRRWLFNHQNPDGGWGDTVRSRSNISTTAICWAVLSKLGESEPESRTSVTRASDWLRAKAFDSAQARAGDVSPDALRAAVLKRYGKDRTFSVPILTVLALCGKLGPDETRAWRSVPQLPFELAALPHGWFQFLQLPVVSYALPALIAIGQVRHARAVTRNPIARLLRTVLREKTHRVLGEMQPASGGYLEAAPLTSFVVMSLAGAGRTGSPVIDQGVRFLLDSKRADGSWPIDTNLSTWVTTLSIGGLAEAGMLRGDEHAGLRRWVLEQQSTSEHPFTHAAPGAWAWTPLSGGVPDADDTSGALLALRHLDETADPDTLRAASAGIRWLMDVQNRDGGVPTFCRGWGTLPFDRSTPEITAHALRAWSAWLPQMTPSVQGDIKRAAGRAISFLAQTQRDDGSWLPLWFGNEHTEDEENPTYGTARVLAGLTAAQSFADPAIPGIARRGVNWLVDVQNHDGGWGGARGVRSTIEETGVSLSGLAAAASINPDERVTRAIARGCEWMIDTTASAHDAAPIGLYFARLWYYEELYPLIFALNGLAAARQVLQSAT